MYWPSVTPRPASGCVIYVSVKFDKMYLYSFGIILNFFSLALYLVVRADGMLGVDFFV